MGDSLCHIERPDQNPTSSFECQCHIWIKTNNDICSQTCCWISGCVWDRKEFPHVMNWQALAFVLFSCIAQGPFFWVLFHILWLSAALWSEPFPIIGPYFVSKVFLCSTKQIWIDLISLNCKDINTSVIAKMIQIVSHLEIRCRERKRAKGIISCSASYSLQLHCLENKWIAGCASVQKYGQSMHCVGPALHVRSNLCAFMCDYITLRPSMKQRK